MAEENGEKKNGGMRQRECDGRVGSPLVEREEIQSPMRPELQGAVAHRDEHAEP